MKNYYFLTLFLISCGGGGSSNSDEFQQRQNTAPQLVGLIDFAIDENTTQVATFKATDADGDAITYSISGIDAALLSIGKSSGVLVFQSPPDYEDPKDSDLDNIYSLTITASDGELSASLGIIISVNDIFEGLGGQNMLLVGNSFFRPYAQKFSELATDADFMDHTDTLVFRGGVFGTPIGLWNNQDTNTEIKQFLDAGNLDIFGMTGYFNETDPTAGFVGYRAAALQQLALEEIAFVGYAFQIEMKFKLWKKGCDIQELPIVFVNREKGVSKMNGSIIWEAIFGVIYLKFVSIFKRI